MKERGQIKKDKDKSIVSFKTESGDDITLGGSVFLNLGKLMLNCRVYTFRLLS